MPVEAIQGVMIPLLGTTLGSACVLFMRRELRSSVQRALIGFAAGVMVAASVWSLLIPAIEQSEFMGTWSFIPAVIGFWIGILFLLTLDKTIPHLHLGSDQPEGAMVYVVVEELIPEMSAGRHSNLGTVFFALGFTVMLTLDVALG